MKFKKKPVIIEAVQWIDGQVSETPNWLKQAMYKPIGEEGAIMRTGNEIKITTLEGEMTASDGDWLIQDVDGKIYPCKPYIFTKTYDEI